MRDIYTIRTRDQEGSCACCGCYLHIGDKAFTDDDIQGVFCSSGCLESAEKEREAEDDARDATQD